ncbi:UNVERIFIED_CONTAM: hypothetical protein K2H54_050983 [Gekko kuhli]
MDDTFRVEKKRPEEEKHLGILGPVIKAEVGDTIQITFANKASWPFIDAARDTNAGLVGPLLICRPGALTEQNKQKGVDKEFYLLFGVFDENLSWYLDVNLKYYLRKEEAFEDHGFQESNRMHAINGFMFSNLPGLDICKGEKVSWHLLGLGTEADVHGVVFQGNTVLMDGMRRDTASLFPHTFTTALMQADNEGSSEVYCQTSNHYQSGMRGRYSVQKCGKKEPFLSRRYERARTIYIMAEEVDWDYAPDRSWELERHNGSHEERCRGTAAATSHNPDLATALARRLCGRCDTAVHALDQTPVAPRPHPPPETVRALGPLPGPSMASINNAGRNFEIHSYGKVFLSRGNGLLGSTYKKAVYREYSDGTFKTPKNRSSGEEEHLGILGPFIWAEVGDILTIVFKNNATRPYSIHAHGIVEKSRTEPEVAMPGS